MLISKNTSERLIQNLILIKSYNSILSILITCHIIILLTKELSKKLIKSQNLINLSMCTCLRAFDNLKVEIEGWTQGAA